jgi:internalin A
MFIVITVACVWLAIVATRARKQQQAVDKVQKLGGVLQFDFQFDSRQRQVPNAQPQAPEWLRRAIGEDYFRRVVTVDFNFGGGNKATDVDLAVFRNLPDVTTIELNNNPSVTDDGLKHLAGLSKLQVLYLYRAKVKGPGIRHLPRNLEVLMLTHSPLEDEGLVSVKNLPRLSALRAGFTNITDRGLVNLSKLAALEDLELRNTDVTDAGLEHLRALKNLRFLSLEHTKVTGAGVARLQQALPNCSIWPPQEWLDAKPQELELWADDYKPSTDELLTKIKELGDSADVRIDKTRPGQPVVSFRLFDSLISEDTLIQLLAQMPELEELNLRRVLVGDRVAKELPRLSKLRFLSLENSRITDDGLADVARIGSLRELSVSNTRVSDVGLMHLTSLPNLVELMAQDCDLSDDDHSKLKQSLPRCRILR